MNEKGTIFRIPDPQDFSKSLGTAYLVHAEQGLVVTCAHVVLLAASGPGKLLQLRDSIRDYTAEVLESSWHDVNDGDIAVLKLSPSERSIEELKAWRMGVCRTPFNRRFATFGYCAAKPLEGTPGTCDFLGETQQDGYAVLGVRSEEITAGFSGAPVWDVENCVVIGMVVSKINSDLDPLKQGTNSAFLIPTAILYKTLFPLFDFLPPPYRGLSFFSEDSDEDYKGRDSSLTTLMTKMESHQLVFVVGESGSGKSSFLRAGIKRGLQLHPIQRLANARRCVVVPTQTIFINLLKALAELKGESPSSIEILFGLSSGSLNTDDGRQKNDIVDQLRGKTSEEIAERVIQLAGKNGLILEIDQLEHIYTMCVDGQRRKRFIDFLKHVAGPAVTVVAAVRLDFGHLCAEHFGTRFFKGRMVLLQMSEEELRAAIVEPASRRLRSVDDLLVEELVEDVVERPGYLPFLQLTLETIWIIDSTNGILTADTYRNLGKRHNVSGLDGVRSVVFSRAEDVWNQSLGSDEEREIGRRILLRLVNVAPVGEGNLPVAPDTGRRARVSEFDGNVESVVEKLAKSFLITRGNDPLTGEGTLELAHESLIGEWRLKDWICATRPFTSWISRELNPWYERWLQHKRSDDYLLPESALFRIRAERDAYNAYLEGSVRQYVDRSDLKRRWEARVWIGFRWLIVCLSVTLLTVSIVLTDKARGNALRAQRNLAQTYFTRAEGALAQKNITEAELCFAQGLVYEPSNANARQGLLQARTKGVRLKGSYRTELEYPTVGTRSNGIACAAGFRERHVRIWESGSGKTINLGGDLSGDGTCGAFDEAGARLAVGTRDGDVFIWNQLDASGVPQRFEKPAIAGGECVSLRFDPLGKQIAASYGNNVVCVISLGSEPRVAHSLTGFSDVVLSCAFSPSGEFVATGSRDRSVRLWRLSGQFPSSTLLGEHQDVVTSVAFSPDARVIASGGKDVRVQTWVYKPPIGAAKGPADWEHWVEGASWFQNTLVGHQSSITGMDFDSTGQYLAASARDRTVRQWDVRTGRLCLTLRGGESPMWGVAYGTNSAKGNILVSADDRGTVRMWSTDEERPELTVLRKAHDGAVPAVAFNRTGLMASGGQDRRIQLWKPQRGGSFIPFSHLEDVDSILWLTFNDDGRLLASGLERGGISVWNLGDNPPSRVPIAAQKSSVWGLAFGKGSELAVGGSEGQVSFWNGLTGATSREPLQLGEVKAYAVAFSPDGRFLSAGARGGGVHLWDLEHHHHYELGRHNGAAWGVAFSPSGKYVASCGEDELVRVWDVSTRKLKSELSGHQGEVWTVCFLSEGEVVSGGDDGAVRIWDWSNRICTFATRESDYTVWCVASSPDRKLVGVAGLDWNVRLWKVPQIRKFMDAVPSSILEEAQRATGYEFDGSQLFESGVH